MQNLIIHPLHPYSPEGGRRCYFQRHYLIVAQYAVDIPGWPLGSGLVLADQQKDDVHWYFSKSDQEYLTLFRSYLDNPDTLKKVETYTDTVRKESCAYVQNLRLDTASKTDLQAAYGLHNAYYIRHLRMASTLRNVDRAVLLSLSGYSDNERKNFLEIVGLPSRPTALLREQRALHVAKQKLNGGKIDIMKLAVELTQKFAWVSLGYHNEQPRNAQSYISMMTESVLTVDETPQDTQSIKEKFISTLSKEKQKLAFITGEIAFLKDNFKFAINEFQYHAQPLLNAIAQRIGISFDEFMWYTPQEILNLLQDAALRIDTSARRRHNAVISDVGNNVTLLEGDAAEKYVHTHVHKLLADQTPTVLHGRPACRGAKTGLARIVQNPNTCTTFHRGDILVAINTTPEYLQLMQQAVAIVAEEGGVTSHTSVTARELGIPCVVGVTHATRAIKDGDLIEVDANNGVVRLLKSVH